MSPTSDQKDQSPWLLVFNSKALVVGGEVGCLTVAIVLAAVLGGLWLDNLLGTKPAITLTLVLASAPLSLVLTIWIAKRSVKDLAAPSSEKEKHTGIQGDDEA